MKRLLSFCLVLSLCSMALAQTLTTMYEYYDYWETIPSARYTVLPNGVKHGTDSRYRKNGTLSAVYQWNRGEKTSVTYYYSDGKTPEEKTVWTEHGKVEITYDIYGKITFHRETDRRADIGMVYYKNSDLTFSLSNDRKIATLKTTDGKLHTTYNIDKNLYSIINAETTLNDDIPLTVKNGVASFTLKEDHVFYDQGKMYRLKKGDKGQFKVAAVSMCIRDYLNQFTESENVKTILLADVVLPADFISKNFSNRVAGIMVHYYRASCLNSDYYIPQSGNLNNGVLVNQNNPDAKLVMKDGQPVEFVYGQDQITSFHVDYDHQGAICIMIDQGTIQLNGITYTGTFQDGNLVNGQLTKQHIYKGQTLQTIYEGQFANSSLIAGKMTQQDILAWHDKGSIPATIVYEGEFKNGELISGQQQTTTQGDLSLTITSQVADRKTIDTQIKGVLTSGCLNVEKYFTNPTKIYFDSIHYSPKDHKVLVHKSNGDTFEGYLSDNLLKSIFERWASKHNNNTFARGKYVTASGSIYVGTFAVGVLSSATFQRSYLTAGTVDCSMPTGRYVGPIFRTKKYDVYAKGHGVWYIDGGHVVEGEFDQDKLLTKLVYKVLYKAPTGETYQGDMLAGKPHGQGKLTLPNGDYIQGEFVKGKFTGNGQVKCTYKNGSFEGQVFNFAPAQGTANPKMTKYLQSIKLPKIILPKEL